LVTRHNVTLTRPDPLTPLSVGNGEFAFTADITGLQTFPDYHEAGMPLGTQSQWGWHTLPNPDNPKLADILDHCTVGGREVPYAADGRTGSYSPAGAWLRANPHRLHLGQIGLALKKADGRPAAIEDLTAPAQSLDLWTGLLTSRFEIDGVPVTVQTVCHPERDLLAVCVTSPLLAQNRLAVSLTFPYAADEWRNAADWKHPERHTTAPQSGRNTLDLLRTLDNDRYHVAIASSATAVDVRTAAPHCYALSSPAETIEAVFAFSPDRIIEPLPEFAAVKTAAADHWRHFWTAGGAVDFSECTDPRAAELERRVILSQYLTAIQCAGSRPPQETGLVCNSWHGKFHLEMHWWHAVHFALWNRIGLLERSLPWYESILPAARATAQMQGYRGARWPKMTAPDGRESPSRVGVFLIWQQPHPIYYAELCYRTRPDRQTLDRYRNLVFETADFMASYPTWDEANNRYVLGPALIPAQESYGPTRDRNLNPTFELAYWHWALQTAQTWRRRLDLEPDPEYARILKHLPKPTICDGVYTAIETEPYTIYRDHPSMVAAYGLVPPTPLIDPATMQRTYDHVLQTWNWQSTWGWDYPMLAMTAARLGRPEKAVDALFIDSPKNRYLANGHNYQSARLPLYLPGNGGLLTAVAMMAAGWENAPETPAPGFPKNGQWNIRFENVTPLP
ncbi:MAG: glycoside hydrolase family 65, partial [Phycisphaerae bacterium]|nr:glycoside hydrolase family 65 [Phycisphaerae bacterium]